MPQEQSERPALRELQVLLGLLERPELLGLPEPRVPQEPLGPRVLLGPLGL